MPLADDVKQQCSGCRYSRVMLPPPLFPEAFREDVHLFCLRMPPTLAGNSDGRGFSSWAVYPTTQDKGWCGEWSAKPTMAR